MKRNLLISLVLALAFGGLIAGTYMAAEIVALKSLGKSTAQRMDLYTANLQSEMRRYEYLPPVVAADPRVLALLADPGAVELKRAVNNYLETVNEQAGAAAIYLMDRTGLTLASSNWRQPASFVDNNFAYRPYFQDAMKGRPGRFYAIGTVSREPGYYFTHGVRNGETVIGVAAVKVNLDRLNEAWDHAPERIAVADANGVVFLSSEPRWRFKTLRALSDETVGRLAATRQYSEAGSLSPLGLRERRVLDDGTAIVQVIKPGESGDPAVGPQYIMQSGPIPDTDWRLLVMADVSPALASARSAAAVASLISVLLILMLLYFKQRRRIVAQASAARLSLERANDELEQKVHSRTEALRDANRRLQSEITERRRAEETLNATLQDLVHTAKMAVLGKLSASITHELNQPLAALQTLSDNTATLLERGRLDEANSNLRLIAHTTARMGQITGQLKKFARRSDVELSAVPIEPVISDAVSLLEQTLRTQRITLRRNASGPQLFAICNANRLEQVIVNLLSNAIDAVQNEADPAVEVAVEVREDHICIEVHDNGPGIRANVIDHLFEPFFTTKAQGVGLGLGLAISNDIVRHFGGSIRVARSGRLGGAVFVVQLKAAIREFARA